ncbi:hypothetical protein Btru_033496 [Bulinus truncatus]|nr:hypothetical protein Btru_033496 [Bulinus truncatus]
MAKPKNLAKRAKKNCHRCGKGKAKASGRGAQKKASRMGRRKRDHSSKGSSRSVVRRRRSRKYPDFEFPRLVPDIMENVNFSHYIRKVMKNVKPNMGLKRKTVEYMDMILKDTLHHIATMASTKMGRRKVLQPLMIKRALKKIMPKALVEKADRVGQRALDKWKEHKTTKKLDRHLNW